MAVTFFSPYGALVKESGFMYLVARYLGAFMQDVVSLRCNGLFTICNEDLKNKNKRNFSSCATCIAKSIALAKWSVLKQEELSKYLKANRLKYIKEELFLVPDDELQKVYYEDLNIYKLCEDSFLKMFKTTTPNINNKKNLQIIKKMMLSSIKMIEALKTYCKEKEGEVFFVPFNNDFLTKSCVEYLKIAKARFICINWDAKKNRFDVLDVKSGRNKSYELYIEDVVIFRNDYTTWSNEFINILNDLIEFLNLDVTEQLSLNF